jgi:hypothetical protein
MNVTLHKIIITGVVIGVSTLWAGEYESSYTSIKENQCRTISTDELGSTQQCKSFANINVQVIDSDLRQSITLYRRGNLYPLNFFAKVSSHWSMLGDKIEWRYRKNDKAHPIAMIVRFKVSEDLNNPNKMTSYLVVSKISPDNICVVGKIPPQANQNQLARNMAQRAQNMDCL